MQKISKYVSNLYGKFNTRGIVSNNKRLNLMQKIIEFSKIISKLKKYSHILSKNPNNCKRKKVNVVLDDYNCANQNLKSKIEN